MDTGDQSPAAIIIAAPGRPAAPTGLAAAAVADVGTEDNSGLIELSWDDPGNAAITGYKINTAERTSTTSTTTTILIDSDALTFTTIGGTPTVSYTATGLTTDTSYDFAVLAVSLAGDGTAATITATPGDPAKVTGLAAVGYDGRLELSWTDTRDAAIAQYEINTDDGTNTTTTTVLIDSDDLTFTTVGSTPTVRYTLESLTNGTAYTVTVLAANDHGDGDASDPATATPVAPPAAPAGLAASAVLGQNGHVMKLEWTPPTATSTGVGTVTVTGYEVSVTDDDGVRDWSGINGSDATTAEHTVEGLTQGTVYTFAVRAVNGTDEGTEATIDAASGRPAAPTGLAAAAVADVGTEDNSGLIKLSWDDPGNAAITGYEVSTDGGTTYTAVTGSDATTTSHTETGLTAGTRYRFRVRALNAHGSAESASIFAVPGDPAAPTTLGVAALPGPDGHIELCWDHPDNATITGYELSIDGGTYTPIATDYNDIVLIITHTVTGLNAGTSYVFAVRAVNARGSAASTIIAAPGVPAAPSGLSAVSGNMQVELSWTDPDNAAITGYELKIGSGDYTRIAGSDATTTSHTATGLANGQSYAFAVRAVSYAGGGTAKTVTAAPGVPTGLSASAVPGQNSHVELGWDDPNDNAITGYELKIDDGTFTAITGSDATTVSHTVEMDLTEGTSYTFTLKALRPAGDTEATITAAPGRPAAPTGLTAAAVESTGNNKSQVTLTWDDPNNAAIGGYKIKVNNSPYQFIVGSNSTTTMHTQGGLTSGNNEDYSIVIRAFSIAGSSSDSNQVIVSVP